MFEAVYTERGISRAADRLNLTQSAVSHALGRLREELGNQLFSRRGHDMVPNSVADQLIEPVRVALSAVESSLRTLSRFDPASSTRHFRIGLRGFTEFVAMPSLFLAARAHAPTITMSTVHHGRSSLPALLASGAVDLAIDTLATVPGEIAAERLGTAGLVAMLRAGHPALDRPFGLEEYLSLDHVVASTRSSGLSLEDGFLERMGRSRRIVLRCQNYVTAAQVVADSDAVLTVPEHFAPSLAGPGRQIVALNTFCDATMDFFMYWSARDTGDPAITWLRDVTRRGT